MKNTPPKLTADEFIQEFIEPLRLLLPYAKINEFTEHAYKIENAFQQDSMIKTYDYLEHAILSVAKERLAAYIKNRLSTRSLSTEDRKKLEFKLQSTHSINNLARFITSFQLLEISIEKFAPAKKPSMLDKVKALFHH